MRRRSGACVRVWLSVMLCAAIFAQTTGASAETSWTAGKATQVITAEEASRLTGVPPEELRVVWSADYSAQTYPVSVKLSLPGLDGLPVYVFERVGDQWVLLSVGTAPAVEIPVEQGGSLSAVTTTVGADYPAKDTSRKAPQIGDSFLLPAILAAAALASAGLLIFLRKKDP